MNTTTRISSTKNIKQELQLLKSFVIGLAGKDKEGDYKPSFVKKTLKASVEKPTHTFKSEKSFLEQIGQ